MELRYAALLSTWSTPTLCEVDPLAGDRAYAYFDEPAEPEVDVAYPATIGFTVSGDGTLSIVEGDQVSCVLALPEGEY